jgi:D-alanyl-lipoteichoic acid acyltransferase DltB (MBOAT superfamily)
MLFPTFDFAIFFAVAFTANWLLNPYPGPWKLAMLALSYFFYGWWDWRFILLLIASTVIAHVGALAVTRTTTERSRKVALLLACAGLLGLLGYFKYYGFLAVNLDNVLRGVGLGNLAPLLQPT